MGIALLRTSVAKAHLAEALDAASGDREVDGAPLLRRSRSRVVALLVDLYA